jgi:hypothetical protein
MVPGTPDRVSDDEAIGERSVVMSAMSANSENTVTGPGQQDIVGFHPSEEHAAVRKIAYGNPSAEVRRYGIVCGGHINSPSLRLTAEPAAVSPPALSTGVPRPVRMS